MWWNLLADFSHHMFSIFREKPVTKLCSRFPENWVELSAILTRRSGTLAQVGTTPAGTGDLLERGNQKQRLDLANGHGGARVVGILRAT
jgi:hypothetical protein